MGLNAIRRLIVATVSSREKRAAWDETIARVQPYLLFLAELLTSPALLHMTLQGLHLSNDNLFIPPAMAFIPFSPWSPVQFVRPSSFTLPGLASWAMNVAESPVMMIWLYRHALVDIHGWLCSAFRARILRPSIDDAHRQGVDSDIEDDMDAQSVYSSPGSRTNLQFLDRALCFLGWSTPRVVEQTPTFVYVPTSQQRHSISIPLPTEDLENNTPTSALQTENGASSDAPQDTNVSAPQGTSQTTDAPTMPSLTTNALVTDGEGNGMGHAEPTPTQHPVSPISTVADDIADPTDASIRIASSEVDTGAVSLEIALPEEQRPASERDTSPHRDGARSRQGMGRISHPDRPEPKALYNVTDLSVEPAEMLSYVLADCLANWILIPVRMCIIYRLAQQYRVPTTRELRAPFLTVSNATFAFPGLKELPLIAGRVALCCAVEGLICAAFWGFECGVVIAVGKKWFGWHKRSKANRAVSETPPI